MAVSVRVRIAPSPTGFAHLGTASTALYNVLFARQHDGAFVLRLDDTDVERNRPEYEALIYESLHWLGLEWDEGPDKGGAFAPYRQSERLDLYREEAARLINEGKAYRCYCTADELEAERRQAQEQRRPYRYSRRCVTDPPRGRTEFTVRFRVPGGEIRFMDMIRGEVKFDTDLIGDFIIVRSDGYPLYLFSSPVDDAVMKITHVIRGEEHISNTPAQLMLMDALGYDRPQAFAHMPLILAHDGAKLSKRKHPEANLMVFKEQGYLPDALLNYLALLGWNPGTSQEIFSFDQLASDFSFERVQHAGARFDWDKLNWINGEYIRALPDGDLAGLLQPFVPQVDEATLCRAVPALKTRMHKLEQAVGYLDYLWTDPPVPALDPDVAARVLSAVDVLEPVPWEPEPIEAALERAVERSGVGKGKFYNPLRDILTGKKVALPIHFTFALLPKDVALHRLRRATSPD